MLSTSRTRARCLATRSGRLFFACEEPAFKKAKTDDGQSAGALSGGAILDNALLDDDDALLDDDDALLDDDDALLDNDNDDTSLGGPGDGQAARTARRDKTPALPLTVEELFTSGGRNRNKAEEKKKKEAFIVEAAKCLLSVDGTTQVASNDIAAELVEQARRTSINNKWEPGKGEEKKLSGSIDYYMRIFKSGVKNEHKHRLWDDNGIKVVEHKGKRHLELKSSGDGDGGQSSGAASGTPIPGDAAGKAAGAQDSGRARARRADTTQSYAESEGECACA